MLEQFKEAQLHKIENSVYMHGIKSVLALTYDTVEQRAVVIK